jgi:hypothetical protein
MRARTPLLVVASLVLVGLLIVPTLAGSRDRSKRFKATLTGFQEVPAISTEANGTFKAKILSGPVIEYTLEYEDIQNVIFAHIHLGQKGVNGGVIAFLCGGGDKPACPATGGTVTGTIDAADVIGPASQGIAAEEIEEAIAAMRAGVVYANVHTSDGMDPANTGPGDFPGGEIRGQLK